MDELIESLRARAAAGRGDKLLEEAAAALEAAREGPCVALVADIRFACGDNGKRMQPELVDFIRGLAADAARYQWLRTRWGRMAETYEDDRLISIGDEEDGEGWDTDPESIDAAIDQARGKGVVE